MDTLISALLVKVIAGGPGGIIAILVIICGFLIWDRKKLLDKIVEKDNKIEKMVNDYYRGNITLSESLNSLKTAFSALLDEIKDKF